MTIAFTSDDEKTEFIKLFGGAVGEIIEVTEDSLFAGVPITGSISVRFPACENALPRKLLVLASPEE